MGETSDSNGEDEDSEIELVDFSGEDSEEPEAAEAKVEADLPPVRLAMLVMTFVIQGYTLIGPLQHDFKHALNISDVGDLGHTFTQAAGFVQISKFAMTLGQRVLLGFVSPVVRVYIAMGLMVAGTIIPPLFVFTLGMNWMGLVWMCYGTIGLSLGIFEPTFLSVITPLGPLTKSWAILGFPAAFGIVNIIGRSCMALFGTPVSVLFWYIVLCVPVGVVAFFVITPPESEGQGVREARLRQSFRDWRSWFLKMVPFMLVNIVSHFVMESVLPAIFNTYNADLVPLYDRASITNLMDKNCFLVVLSIFNMAGDILSRKFGYCLELDRFRANMFVLGIALVCCIGGLALTIRGVAIESWFAVFLAFWGAGLNYAVTAKYIDRFVPREHNLAAYSLWMFVGYGGAIMGSYMVDTVRYWICGDGEYPYECLASLS